LVIDFVDPCWTEGTNIEVKNNTKLNMVLKQKYRSRGMSTENHQRGKDNLPPVTGYPDVGEAERRRQEGAASEHPQEFAADSAAGGDLLPNILSGLKYPATRKEILDFLHLRRERIENAEVILKAVGLLPADRDTIALLKLLHN
jgi:hypothetical protein